MILFTPRCTLSLLNEFDFNDAVKLFTNDQVRMYLGGSISEKQAYDKLQKWINCVEDLYISVRHSSTNEFIGLISITEHHDSKEKELSYQFLPEWWGQGYAEESLRELLKYFRKTSYIKVLLAETQVRNIHSNNLLKKLGFVVKDTVCRFEAEQNIYELML